MEITEYVIATKKTALVSRENGKGVTFTEDNGRLKTSQGLCVFSGAGNWLIGRHVGWCMHRVK